MSHEQNKITQYAHERLWVMVFNASFNNIFSYIVPVSFIDGGNIVLAENHRPVTNHWQTLSHNVVSSTLHHKQGSNSQLS